MKKDWETVPVSPGSILYIESVDDKVFAYTKKDVVDEADSFGKTAIVPAFFF